MATETDSFSAIFNRKKNDTHKHKCPTCGVIWEHHSPACQYGGHAQKLAPCPTVKCTLAYLDRREP